MGLSYLFLICVLSGIIAYYGHEHPDEETNLINLKRNKTMWKFKVVTDRNTENIITATYEGCNCEINGKLIDHSKEAQKQGVTQEMLFNKQEYKICLSAVRREIQKGETYLFSGSWNNYTLHATNVFNPPAAQLDGRN